jgi:mannitol 2-dehydrogenase
VLVHLGLGAFARSHLLAYVSDLPDPEPVVGVGLLPGDAAVRDALAARGNRYDLVLAHPDGTRTSRELSLTEYLFAPEDREAVLSRLADPCCRIVTLTVTEGGWGLPTAPAPGSAAGLVVEGLRRRRAAGLPPYAVLSCDNVQDNGHVARDSIAGYADLVDAELGAWVRSEVAFPCSMVDRITPAPTDQGVVVAEPFRQWVVEDRFPLGRPRWEDAGALLVEDVRPYELVKLRLLNAGHQVLAYPALLLGHALVHDAVPDLAPLLRAWWDEARPTLAPAPGIDLDDYTATLLERFANAHVADTVARLACFASDRVPGFVLPVVRDNLAAGRPVPVAALVLAAWARSLETGREVIDTRAVPAGEALLDDPVLGGLGSRPELRTPFLLALAALRADPRAALAM